MARARRNQHAFLRVVLLDGTLAARPLGRAAEQRSAWLSLFMKITRERGWYAAKHLHSTLSALFSACVRLRELPGHPFLDAITLPAPPRSARRALHPADAQ